MKQRALELLRRACGDPSAQFRPGQWDAIQALVEGRGRLLVVQRTGWGKSMVYFIATRLLRDQGSGCALLISPLLALMRNQIAAAERIGVRAETINSSNQDDWPAVETALRAGPAISIAPLDGFAFPVQEPRTRADSLFCSGFGW